MDLSYLWGKLADVIGSTSGWSNGAWAEVSSRLVTEGVVVTISAGNSGRAGPFFASSGSSGENVLAVASVETEKLPASPFGVTLTLDGVSNTTKARCQLRMDCYAATC